MGLLSRLSVLEVSLLGEVFSCISTVAFRALGNAVLQRIIILSYILIGLISRNIH
jgi:hypothetical protein